MKKLRFVARGSALVPNFERHEVGVRAFVGRKWTMLDEETIAAMVPDPLDRARRDVGLPTDFDFDGAPRYAFVGTNEPEEVPNRAEYVKACADGDLWPADEHTARVCNAYARAHGLPEVKFDAKLGEGVRNALVRTDTADEES